MHVNSLCAMIIDFAYIKNCARCKIKYSGRSAVHIPGWSGQFWANYSPVFPIEMIMMIIIITSFMIMSYVVGGDGGGRGGINVFLSGSNFCRHTAYPDLLL